MASEPEAAERRPATTTVHRHNVRVVLPFLQQLAAKADAIALDLEFTGLGAALQPSRAAYDLRT